MAIFAGKRKRVGTAWKRTYDRIPSTPYWPGVDDGSRSAAVHHRRESVIQGNDSVPEKGDQTAQNSVRSEEESQKPAFRRRHKKAESSTWTQAANEGTTDLTVEKCGEAPVNTPPSPPAATVNNPTQVTPSAPNPEKAGTTSLPTPPPVQNISNEGDPAGDDMLSKWNNCFPSLDPKLIQVSLQQLSRASVALAPFQKLLSQLPGQEHGSLPGITDFQKLEDTSALQRTHSALDDRESYIQKLHADHTTLLQQQLEEVRQDRARKEEALRVALNNVGTLKEADQIKTEEWTNRLRQLEEDLDLKTTQIEKVQQDREQFSKSSMQRVEEGLKEIERLRKENSKLVAHRQRLENENNRMRKMLSETIAPSEHPSEPQSPGDRSRKRPRSRYMLKYASPHGSPSKQEESHLGSPLSANSSVSSTRAVTARPPAKRIIPGNSFKDNVHDTKSSLREFVPSFSQLASVDSLHRAGYLRDRMRPSAIAEKRNM